MGDDYTSKNLDSFIDVISNESGIDDLTTTPPIEKDSAFDSGNKGRSAMQYRQS